LKLDIPLEGNASISSRFKKVDLLLLLLVDVAARRPAPRWTSKGQAVRSAKASLGNRSPLTRARARRSERAAQPNRRGATRSVAAKNKFN
jgi:hypothetical protein